MINIKCPYCNHKLSLATKQSKMNGFDKVHKITPIHSLTTEEQIKFIGFINGLINQCDDYDVNRIVFLTSIKDKITNL